MIAGWLSASLWLGLGPAPTEPAPVVAEQPTEQPASYSTLFVRVGEPIDAAVLTEHLRLRLPSRTILDHRDMREAPDDAHLYVDLRALEGDRVALTIIGSDGRAYDRELELDPQDPTRVLATSVANLVYSIEERSVEPSRIDVAIPEPEPPAAPEPEPPPEPDPDPPKPEPAPQQPEPRSQPEPKPTRSWQLGLAIEPGVALGFGPPRFADPLAGGGGSLGVRALAPTSKRGGALSLALSLRTLARTADEFTLIRTRVALAAGWRFTTVGRRETGSGFSIGLAGQLAVEPWWVRRSGETVRYHQGDAPLLLSAGVRVSPGWMLRGRAATLLLGPMLELAGSLAPAADWTVPGVSHDDGDDSRDALFRVGGLELGVGLEAVVLFGL